jgi:hypothetical protein
MIDSSAPAGGSNEPKKGEAGPAPMSSLLGGVKVINIGLACFADSLWAQDVPCVHVDWSPPAETDEEMDRLLESLL